MVTRKDVHEQVFRRYQRAQGRLRPLTEDPGYTESAYSQMEAITKAWGLEKNAQKEPDNSIWRLLDEAAGIPKFDGKDEVAHLLGPVYAALWMHGGMYDYEIAHATRKPVFAINHGLKVLAGRTEGCPLQALGSSKCVNVGKHVRAGRSDTGYFGGYLEAVLRYANPKAKGTGVLLAASRDNITFTLEDGTQTIFEKKAEKFSYNGKPVEPPQINDLFRKSWYEWRAKHGKSN